MLNKIKYKLFGKFQNKKRLEQMKKNPFKRVDSQKMTCLLYTSDAADE